MCSSFSDTFLLPLALNVWKYFSTLFQSFVFTHSTVILGHRQRQTAIHHTNHIHTYDQSLLGIETTTFLM